MKLREAFLWAAVTATLMLMTGVLDPEPAPQTGTWHLVVSECEVA